MDAQRAITLRAAVTLVETSRDGCEAAQALVTLLTSTLEALEQLDLRQALAARGQAVTLAQDFGVTAYEEALLLLANEASGIRTLTRVTHGWKEIPHG